MRAKLREDDPLSFMITADDREPTDRDFDMLLGFVIGNDTKYSRERGIKAIADIVHCINDNPGCFRKTHND